MHDGDDERFTDRDSVPNRNAKSRNYGAPSAAMHFRILQRRLLDSAKSSLDGEEAAIRDPGIVVVEPPHHLA